MIKESRGFQVLELDNKVKCLGRVKHDLTLLTTIIKVLHKPIDMAFLSLSSKKLILNHHLKDDQLLNEDLLKRRKFRLHGSAALCQYSNNSNSNNNNSSNNNKELDR